MKEMLNETLQVTETSETGASLGVLVVISALIVNDIYSELKHLQITHLKSNYMILLITYIVAFH